MVLPLPDRVLLVAVDHRTNLTMQQLSAYSSECSVRYG